MNPSGGPQPDTSAARLQRLEEHSGFLEHTVEQLSREIAELNQRLARLAKRLEGLESRIAGVEAGGRGDAAAESERPPHSAGPPPSDE